MYTRCTHCETFFRVTREQLQISSGQVKCGRCQQVFDAFATLTSQLPAASSAPPAPDRAAEPSLAAAPKDQEPRPPAADPMAPAAPSSTEARFSSKLAAADQETEILTLPDDLFGTPSVDPDGQRPWPWIIASLAAVLVLALQATYLFATSLASQMPELRSPLAGVCRWLGCQVALPRLPDQLFIEASDLQVLNPARPTEVLLTVTIRNRAVLTQTLPLIELTLTDSVNQTAARKVFYPADYLDPSHDQRQGIGPNQEIAIRLYLDTGDVKAAGYRLYLFFA